MELNEMIESVSNYLSYFGDVDYSVVQAIKNIDRKPFCQGSNDAYLDIPYYFEEGFVIQPSILARILSLASISKRNSVLEVGSGSGWTATVLAHLSRPGKVLSLDIDLKILEEAKNNSKDFKLSNLNYQNTDFWDLDSKFDRIIFSCGVEDDEEQVLLDWLREHLNEKGRAVFPHVEGPLVFVRKSGDNFLVEQTREEYCFDSLV